jgi:hypothetical protein
MYGSGLERMFRSPDSVATTTLPPGHSSDESLSGERSRIEAHIAALGIHGYVTELGQGSNPAYLAWEAVRKNRAAEIVGEVFSSDGQLLPYTGFEGDFVGQSPERIIEIEEGLGERILRSIHINFGIHNAASGLREHEVLAALHGEPMSARHVREIMGFFDCLFKEIRAQAKPINPPEIYERFRAGTYQKVESGQAFTETVTSHTSVTIATPEKTEAYKALAEIGIFGHPELRTMYDPKHEKIAGDGIFAMKTFHAQVNTSGGDDNPLSR